MKSNKDDKSKIDNDLNFVPLNIENPLGSNNNFPLNYNLEEISMTKTYGTLSLSFPTLNLNPLPMPLNTTPLIESAPLTPYPKNIPTLEESTNLSPNVNNSSKDEITTNIPNTNTTSNNTFDLEYPDEDNDFLYSYNESRLNENYLDNLVNPIDILRNFDISLDFDSDIRKDNCTTDDIDSIFSIIEKDYSGILATLKAYRIPYPIAKLLIKKIIKISLLNCKR